MKKYSLLLFIFLNFVTGSLLYATAPQVQKIESISQFLSKPDTLKKGDILLLDIDGTLMLKRICPVRYNLSSQDILNKNLVFLEKVKEKHGQRAYKRLKKMKTAGESLTEPALPEILKKLQNEKGVHIFLLTNRNEKRQNETERELSSLGYSLERLSQYPKESFGIVGDHIFIDGIFYKHAEESKPTSKGLSIIDILAAIRKEKHFSPQAIYFIDEKQQNIEGAEQVLRQKNPDIPVHLIHYEASPRFDTPEKLEAFYRENTPHFEKYESLFKETFYK